MILDLSRGLLGFLNYFFNFRNLLIFYQLGRVYQNFGGEAPAHADNKKEPDFSGSLFT